MLDDELEELCAEVADSCGDAILLDKVVEVWRDVGMVGLQEAREANAQLMPWLDRVCLFLWDAERPFEPPWPGLGRVEEAKHMHAGILADLTEGLLRLEGIPDRLAEDDPAEVLADMRSAVGMVRRAVSQTKELGFLVAEIKADGLRHAATSTNS